MYIYIYIPTVAASRPFTDQSTFWCVPGPACQRWRSERRGFQVLAAQQTVAAGPAPTSLPVPGESDANLLVVSSP